MKREISLNDFEKDLLVRIENSKGSIKIEGFRDSNTAFGLEKKKLIRVIDEKLFGTGLQLTIEKV